MFERRSDPLISKPRFLRRIVIAFLITLGLAALSIALGTVGHRLLFEDLTWSDSYLRTCLILAEHDVKHDGNARPKSALGTVFAGLFGLYARLVFVSLVAILIVPIVHRIIHRLHLTEEGDDGDRDKI